MDRNKAIIKQKIKKARSLAREISLNDRKIERLIERSNSLETKRVALEIEIANLQAQAKI